MVHPYLVNTINALVLIVAGLVGYFISAANAPTALIAPAFGLLLLACTHHLRKNNRLVLNTVTALTLIMGLATILRVDSANWSVTNILLLLIGVSCFIAVAFYVGTFVQERRMRNNNIYKEDL